MRPVTCHRIRTAIVGVGAACAVGCHSAPPPPPAFGPAVTDSITAASLDSIPRFDVHDGTLVCQADGVSPCPIALATANWMNDHQFATWERDRPVQVWTPGKIDPLTIGEVGAATGQYQLAVSVAHIAGDYVVIDAQRAQSLAYDDQGRFVSAMPIPAVSNLRAVGFTGSIALMQRVLTLPGDSVASFQVRELDTPGDTAGLVVLNRRIGWLRLRNGTPVRAVPLFPALPSYTILPDSDIVWTPGDSFTARRQSNTGAVRWTLSGSIPGPPVTAAEIDTIRAQYAARHDPVAMQSFDSSVAHSSKNHPALSGVMAARDGRVLLVGAQIPARDSLDLYLLTDHGQPRGRVTVPRSYHLLLYAGDSVLIQRPEPNMHEAMRWIVLQRP